MKKLMDLRVAYSTGEFRDWLRMYWLTPLGLRCTL